MIDPQFLAMLVCPVTKQPLREATAAELAAANEAIASGALKSRSGNAVDEPLDAALAAADGAWLYAIRDAIPILLAPDAMAPPAHDAMAPPAHDSPND